MILKGAWGMCEERIDRRKLKWPRGRRSCGREGRGAMSPTAPAAIESHSSPEDQLALGRMTPETLGRMTPEMKVLWKLMHVGEVPITTALTSTQGSSSEVPQDRTICSAAGRPVAA